MSLGRCLLQPCSDPHCALSYKAAFIDEPAKEEEKEFYILASQQGCVDMLGKSSLLKSTGLCVNHV